MKGCPGKRNLSFFLFLLGFIDSIQLLPQLREVKIS